jgi:hypothetical protein
MRTVSTAVLSPSNRLSCFIPPVWLLHLSFSNPGIYIGEDVVNKTMNENHKTMVSLVLSIVILALSLLAFLVPMVTAQAIESDGYVTRTVSTATPDSTFDVMLNITGLQIGGIVETIPDGFVVIRTTHPSNQTYISEQKVLFVVVNETAITYEVRAVSSGSGTFRGLWYDTLTETEGDIKDTSVSIRITPTPLSSPTPTPSPSTPGFEAVCTLAGLFVVAVLFLFLGIKGGEGA